MTDATGKIRYNGDLVGMRQLMFCLKEEGLQATVETSEERRDVLATVMAIIAIVEGAPGLLDLAGRIRNAIRKFREMNPAEGSEIEVIEPGDAEPDDAGFSP
jgi:hypothetical protein